MSLGNNIDRICKDIHRCLIENGYDVEEKGVYIKADELSNLLVNATTNDAMMLHFSMKLSDKYLICKEDNRIKLDTTKFKSSLPIKPLTKEEAEQKWIAYNEYLFEIGDITEDELEKALAEE